MPFRWKSVLLIALCCVMFFATNVFSQDGSPDGNGKCGFQTLVFPSSAGTTATPTALNDKGTIVGLLQSGTGAATQHIAFYFGDGKFIPFRFPGSHSTFVYDINAHGVIVGSFDTSSQSREFPFMVRNGVFTKIALPGFSNHSAAATGINGLGDITGQLSGEGSANLGFLLHQGELTIVSFPGAAGGTFPTGINDQGIVVGTYKLIKDGQPHGFTWQNGNFTNVDVPGPVAAIPVKISNRGDIVGTFADGDGIHGLAIDTNHFFFIDRPGFKETQFIAVNKFDNVLGAGIDAAGQTTWFKGFCSAVF